MALGTNYNNNNQQNWEPTYYSRLRIKNTEQNIALTFNFWKGTLKVILTETSSEIGSKPNDLAYIHLSPTKAKVMAEAVDRIMKSDEDVVYGVDTGTGETRGFIAVGRDQGKPFLFIAKVNSEGAYESSQRFNFNVDYNYLLKVTSIDKLSFDREYMNSIELMQLHEVFTDYSRFASGVLGASFYDIGRYENKKVSDMVKKIAEKVGVDSNSYSGRQNNSFFDGNTTEYSAPVSNNTSTRTRYQNINSLEDELG